MSNLINNSVEQKYVSIEERDALINLLQKHLNLDLSEYSLSSVSRRFTKLFNDFGVDSAGDFMQKLLMKPNPYDTFLREFTVNVTEMFRDPNFYKSLVKVVFPVLAKKETIKIWCAACSSGEEPISLSILLHEANLLDKAQIIGTDISTHMIELAKKAIYKKRSMNGYDKSYVSAGGQHNFFDYFTEDSQHLTAKPFLLAPITYLPHNLKEAPIDHDFDLIICRNALIYFNKNLQSNVIDRFATALKPNKSFLGLGSKESIIFYINKERFKEIDREYKIYQKTK